MILLNKVQSYCKSPIFQNKKHFFYIFSHFTVALEDFFCTFAPINIRNNKIESE